MRLVEEKLAAQGAKTPDQRRAAFVAALCLAWPDGDDECFEGRVEGTLVWPPRGKMGFGYDPMFLPDGYDKHLRRDERRRKTRAAAARPRALAPGARLPEIRGGLPWLRRDARAPDDARRRRRSGVRRLCALAVLPRQMPLLRLQQPRAPREARRDALRARDRGRARAHARAHRRAHGASASSSAAARRR